MRNYRQIFAIITLFCLFFELCEPSTNFIRTSAVSAKQEQVLKIQFQVDGSGASKNQDHDHGPSLKNLETHAAQIVVSYHFEPNPIDPPVYKTIRTDLVHSGYLRSIFQPPKSV